MLQPNRTILLQLKAIGDTYIAPDETFAAIDKAPRWIVLLLVLTIGNILVTHATIPFVLKAVEVSMPQGSTAHQITDIRAHITLGQQIGVFFTPLLLVLKWTIFAGLLWLAVVLATGDGDYKRLFSLAAHANLISFAGSLFVLVILHLRGIDVIQSAADLQPAIGLNLVLHPQNRIVLMFLGSINLFEIWYVVVLVIGLVKLAPGITKLQAATIASGFWLVICMVQIGITLLSGQAA
jgi:Yip1 domain